MAGKEQDYRIFVGGLSWDVTDRQLGNAFNRFGKVLDCQVMLDRETGRPRGFGFLTFADRRAMEDAIREMDGREIGDRMISVNKAQPKMGDEEPGHGYSYSSGGRGRGTYGGGDRSAAGHGECFNCGRSGHWVRDCPSAGGARGARPLTPPRPRFGGAGGRGGRYGGDRDRYVDNRYDSRRDDRERYDNKDDRYGSRDRYVSERYPPPSTDRFVGDRYGGSDRYPQNGYGKDRGYERDGGPRGSSDRYGGGGGGGGPARYEARNQRERPAPYDRPRRAAGHAPSFERY